MRPLVNDPVSVSRVDLRADGKLIGAPHMEQVPGFDKADYRLHRVNLGVWEGFIFVNLGDASTQRGGYRSLEEWFAPLNGKFSHWNMSILQPAKRIEYDVRANWKLMFENYSECYHCPGVHPQLQKVSPYDSAENDLREGPFLGGFMKINPGKSLTMSGNTSHWESSMITSTSMRKRARNACFIIRSSRTCCSACTPNT